MYRGCEGYSGHPGPSLHLPVLTVVRALPQIKEVPSCGGCQPQKRIQISRLRDYFTIFYI